MFLFVLFYLGKTWDGETSKAKWGHCPPSSPFRTHPIKFSRWKHLYVYLGVMRTSPFSHARVYSANLAKHVMQPWCWDFNTDTISGWIQKHPQKVLLIQSEEEQPNDNNMPPQSHAQEHSSTWKLLLAGTVRYYDWIYSYYTLLSSFWNMKSRKFIQIIPQSSICPIFKNVLPALLTRWTGEKKKIWWCKQEDTDRDFFPVLLLRITATNHWSELA